MNKEKHYIITYIQNNEAKTIERTETEEELKERIKTYKKNNIEIIEILEKIISIDYKTIKF